MSIKKYILGNGRPLVIIVGCLHGDETIGKRIIDKLKKIDVQKGTVVLIVANQKAYYLKKRFIKQDLNRSFPGRRRGNHEEMLAYKIKKVIQSADFVFDIHSTTTDVRSLAIITKYNLAIASALKLFHPRRVALMKKDIGKKAMTYFCKCGISFEYGKDKNRLVFRRVFHDILLILKKIKMINTEVRESYGKTDYFKITGTIKKPKGFIISSALSNFKIIKKGDIMGRLKKRKVISQMDFYPVLFGKEAYKDILGFSSKRVRKL